ncbi:MAG: sugar transferase [Victivallales bacterium]|nr:sugar transferase [Victivallales bacterium]
MERKGKDPNDADLEKLLKEISYRAQGNSRSSLKIAAWKFTVRCTYFVKRLMDIVVSAVGLLILLPLFLVIAVAVKLSSPGPAIFTQIRVGRRGRHFHIYKFRTMRADAERLKEDLATKNESEDGVTFKMHNDPRITAVGGILRKTSMDELPQLWNVFIGDMSLVGPRPPLPSEVREYTLEDRKRLNVVPGLTCLWQIKGRSDIPFHEQVRLDKEYIRSSGIWNDIVILCKTIPAIISGRGAY